MTRTMTVDLGIELRGYVENLVALGDYKSNSEVLRDSLRALKEKQANSKLELLRLLIDEGKESGQPILWNADAFIKKMQKKSQ